MSKELPYFQFEPSQWMMGRIQRESADIQIAFLRLICKYWHNECVMSSEDAELECGEDEYKVLVKRKIIQSDDEFISIKFLDSQLADIHITKGKNSIAGQASAKARALKKLEAESNARSTPVQRNPTKKRKGKERKEDDIKEIPLYLDFETYALENQDQTDLNKLKLKYESWKVNGWKDGKNNPIKNWKTKILNTLPYLKKENDNGTKKGTYGAFLDSDQ